MFTARVARIAISVAIDTIISERNACLAPLISFSSKMHTFYPRKYIHEQLDTSAAEHYMNILIL
jgi:hypothetical protein